MVSLILRPNRRIDRKLFYDAVYYCNDRYEKPVNIRIIGVETDEIRIKHGMCYYVRLYIEIRQHNFKCKAYYMEDGKIDKTKTQLVNASWETIAMRFKLTKNGNDKITGENLYKFETDHVLFDLMNYAFIKKEYIQTGNNQGIKNVNATDIKNALRGLDVKIHIVDKYGIIKMVPTKGE